MKKLVVLICFWGSITSVVFSNVGSVQTALNNTQISSRDEAKILLAGSLAGSGILRSLLPPIQATQSSSFITVDYLSAFSNIRVEITNALQETMYLEINSPAAGEQLFIPVGSWENGNYTIAFTNSSGDYLYGEFTIAN